MKKSTVKNRIWELDFLRGLSILLVVIDHAMYDISRIFPSWRNSGVGFLEWLNSLGSSYLVSDVRFLWRPAFLFIFFFTSGLCTAFSRNNFFRGLKLTIVAASVSIITYYAERVLETDAYAMFGVLHCLAVIILTYSAVEAIITGVVKITAAVSKKPYDKKLERILHIVLCLILGAVFLIINKFYNVPLSEVTTSYEAIETDSKILGLFFYCKNWWTADYFPLFPFIGFFFLGAGCTRIVYEKRRSLLPDLDGIWHQPFTFPGRHSLLFYLAGQVVFVLLCVILNATLM